MYMNDGNGQYLKDVMGRQVSGTSVLIVEENKVHR